MNIPKGTLVTVRTTNGGEVTAKLVDDYAPTTYLWSLQVVLDRPSYNELVRQFLPYLIIPGYRVKSVELAA